jgi:predicted aldo/keto reductase-like oxidoreductase
VQYARLTSSGIVSSRLICGGARFPVSWQDENRPVPAEAQRNVDDIVDVAFALGVTHFETARAYGTGESQLGRALSGRRRDTFLIQTKIAPCLRASQFAELFGRSLQSLKVEYVDLLTIHGINNAQLLYLARRSCIPVALELKRRGLCRAIGFSSHAEPELIHAVIESEPFEYVSLHWYFANQYNRDVVRTAAERGVGVNVISPNFMGGMLFAPPHRLRSLCHPFDCMEFNDAFCIARGATTVSVGPRRASDLALHVSAIERLAEPEVSEVERRLRAAAADRVGHELVDGFCRALPEWQKCPGGINMREITRLMTLARAFDLWEYAGHVYSLLDPRNHWNAGANAEHAERWREQLAEEVRSHPAKDVLPDLLIDAHRELAGLAGDNVPDKLSMSIY